MCLDPQNPCRTLGAERGKHTVLVVSGSQIHVHMCVGGGGVRDSEGDLEYLPHRFLTVSPWPLMSHQYN